MHYRPAEIFDIATDESTNIDVSLEEYELKSEHLKTKCGWTPFAGRHVIGRVERVRLRSELAYENGQVLAAPGSGHLIG
jgi:dihydroorotase-like cyclic amidohydrolase